MATATTRDSTVEKLKVYLRLSHNALDTELSDQVDSCLADLESNAGILTPDETDPLIFSALKLWCKANTEDDVVKADAFQKRYEAMRDTLSMNCDYIEGEPND